MASRRIDEHTLQVLEFDQVLAIVASFASSDLGKQATRRLYPSTDPKWIQTRCAQARQLQDLLEKGQRLPLAGIRDIRPLLDRLGRKQTVLEPDELIQISQTLKAANRVRGFLLGLETERFRELRCLSEHLYDLHRLVEAINQSIDTDCKVRSTASVKLATLRDSISQLKARIHQRYEQIISDPQVHKALENDKIVTRHGRPVLAVKAHYKSYIRGTVLDRSNTGATLYVEPESLVELNNQLEELVFEEKKETNRILWELTHQVLAFSNQVRQTLHTLGIIDLTYAKARFGIAYRLSYPQLAQQPLIKLIDARHPLLVKIAAERNKIDPARANELIVPFSPRIGGDLDLLLVTGPNAGGKTVLLKTVGLCVLLAQSGCPIPASSGSQIGIYSQVFADIGDQQSIQSSLSTFSAHIKQVIKIMARARPGTLILLDELGAGTDPQEGAALAAAILDELLAKGTHIVATTHMGQLKAYAFSRPRAENASLLFDTETLTPTFRLLMGTPGSSNALAIAQRLGMARRIIASARQLLGSAADQTSKLVNEVQKVRQLAEDRRIEAQNALEQARRLQGQLAQQLEQLKEQEQLLRRQADMSIDQALRQVKDLVNDFCRAVQNAPKPWPDKAKALLEQVDAILQASPLAARHKEFIQNLRRGDSVYMIPFRSLATVDKIRYNRGTIVLMAGSKQIELGLDQICRPQLAGEL